MSVTFYKTKMSGNNRCYDRQSYLKYLSSCEKKKYNIGFDIIPNTPFYLPENNLDKNWRLYNYIVFDYGGMQYGAFIISLQPLATDGTIEIRHSTDNWFLVLMNNLNIDFHGQCVRAHVNDIIETNSGYVSDLSNTLLKAEEQVTSQGYKYVTKSISNSLYQYLYIIINNPTQQGITQSGNNTSQRFVSKPTKSDGVNGLFTECPQLIICGILGNNGVVTFQFIKDGEAADYSNLQNYNTKITEIQWEGITNMVISNIPPCPMKEVKIYRNSASEIVGYVGVMENGDFIGHNEVGFSNLAGMPSKCYYPKFFTYVPFYFEIENVDYVENGDTLKLYDKNTLIFPEDNFENYINNGIVKLHSSVYNPMYYCGDIIDYSQLKTIQLADNKNYIIIDLQLSMDLTSVWSIIESETVDERSSFKITNLNTNFTPSVQRSYFDKYDLSLAGLNAERKINNAGYELANAAIGTVSSITPAIGHPEKTLSAGVGAVQGMTNFARANMNLQYTKKIENLTLEKTQGQITNGKISSNTPVGYYASQSVLDYNNFKFVKVNKIGFKQLYPLLHRYGYNTVLQLDEVYKNHRRKYFNYIQTSECDVNGVSLDIAQDIEEMFNSGVHLWSGEVEKWEVANYQNDIIFPITK